MVEQKMRKPTKQQLKRLSRFSRYYCGDLPGYQVYSSHTSDAYSEFLLIGAALGVPISQNRFFVDSSFRFFDLETPLTHFEETVLIPALLALPDNESLVYSPPTSVQLKLFSDET